MGPADLGFGRTFTVKGKVGDWVRRSADVGLVGNGTFKREKIEAGKFQVWLVLRCSIAKSLARLPTVSRKPPLVRSCRPFSHQTAPTKECSSTRLSDASQIS